MSPYNCNDSEKTSIKNVSKTNYFEEKLTSYDISKNKKKTEEKPKEEFKSKISLSKSHEAHLNVSKYFNSINKENQDKKEFFLKKWAHKFKKFIKTDEEDNDISNNDLHSISMPLHKTKTQVDLNSEDTYSEPLLLAADSSLINKHSNKNNLHPEHHKHSVATVTDLLGAINKNEMTE